jgi:hypothetical protein
LDFSLDPELMERTGCEVSTLSEQLKRVFGWAARTTGDGIIPIVERGAAICALHDVFSAFFTKYPDNNVLKKWIIDVMVGAEKVYKTYNIEVRPDNFNGDRFDRSDHLDPGPIVKWAKASTIRIYHRRIAFHKVYKNT